MFSDGHTHSTFSDGQISPDEIIDLAYKIMRQLGETEGLLSICDHNNVSAVDESLRYSQNKFGTDGIELYFLPGAEVDAKRGTHLLLYFFPEDQAWKRRDILDIFQKNEDARDERNCATIDRLEEILHIGLEYEDLYDGVGGIRTRLPIVEALVNRGYAPNVDTAKRIYVEHGCPAHIPFVPPFEAEEILQIASDSGVFTAIAHPHGKSESELLGLLSSGLNGIEVVNGRSRFNEAYLFALKNHLSYILGSDCHFNGTKRFGYSDIRNHGGKQMPTHYSLSTEFIRPIEEKLRETLLSRLR